MSVYLNGLATAVPPHAMPQDLVQETARKFLWPRNNQFERMSSSFETAGVDCRYSMAPVEWFHEEKNWRQRNDQYLQTSKDLFIEVARKALSSANLEAGDIDTIVTVSSTGIATPTLEARAWKDMGFRTDVRRIPVFGLGCAGGVTGLSVARAQAKAHPGSHVLMVALEACTLSFRANRFQKADIIATVLFGDGAAAACLSTEQHNPEFPAISLKDGLEELWPDTLDIMGWDVDETGMGVVFDRSIPAFAEENFASAVNGAMERSGGCKNAIDRFVCHPGGAKVVEAIETALDLKAGHLEEERSVLRDYGNMSAPTVMFVLKRVIESGQTGKMLMSALGPGFTASFLPFEIGTGNA